MASPRGFCAGVHRAVQTVERTLEKYPNRPVRVFHQIVHNKHVVRSFEARNVKFIRTLDGLEPDAILIFSAHGVNPQLVEAAGKFQIIDATCPLVRKIHVIADDLGKRGYQLFLIGHHRHVEVTATLGYCPPDTVVVEDISDVENLHCSKGKSACLMQTTLNIHEAEEIYQAIRARFPGCENHCGICYATANRQQAVKEICSRKVDIVFIVGSRSSSNSRRLRECAEDAGVRALLIEDADAIEPQMLTSCRSVGLSAGASAPEMLVRECLEKIRALSQCNVEIIESAGSRENTVFSLPEI